MSATATRGSPKAEVRPQQNAPGAPKCLAVSQRGITTAGEFAQFMSALISDLIEGNMTPQVGNAAVNAGGKLLKVVEMQYKYGKTTPDGSCKSLDLISPPSE